LNRFLILVSAMALAGCDSGMNGWVPSIDTPPAHVSPRVEADPPPPDPPAFMPSPASTVSRPSARARADAYCRGVARQRMLDAKTYGYDRDMLSAIFNGAYDDCEAWRVRGAQ